MIGTATLVLPWYPPPVAAKQLADIDRACGGRLIVGAGGGGEYTDDFAGPRACLCTSADRVERIHRFVAAVLDR